MRNRRTFLASTVGAAACANGAPAPAQGVAEPALFELRNYQTQPGRRDDLIAMFEASFLDAYEAGGARIVATFTDLDDPDRWVWIRAFRDGAARRDALNAFYGSAAWRRQAEPANATIADTSNVLLLRPWSGSANASNENNASASIIAVAIYLLPPASEEAFAAFFANEAAPELQRLGAAPLATFVTDRSPNLFPRQHVRSDSVFVTLTRFDSPSAYAAFVAARARSAPWRDRIEPELSRRTRSIESLRLQPTTRSRLR